MFNDFKPNIPVANPENLLRSMSIEALHDGKRWFPEQYKSVFFTVACLAGEGGEALNLAKKIERGDFTWTDPEIQQKLREEIVDSFTYTLHIAALLDMDLYVEYYKKRKFNSERFTK